MYVFSDFFPYEDKFHNFFLENYLLNGVELVSNLNSEDTSGLLHLTIFKAENFILVHVHVHI